MGEVYRARDTKLKREVAIKTLPEEFSRDPERLARFQREAEALAALNHPNIAHVYGLEESANTRCIVMELVEGETLQQRLTRGAIPVEETLQIAKQIAEALEAAHERGIIHRDLKPGNIKITTDGKVKVLDFGLAKAFDREPSTPDLSQSPTLMSGSIPGVILGTAAYMSPEQARGQATDRTSDIWAFGCVLYEMLAGKPAFDGPTITDILAAVVKTDPDWNPLAEATPASILILLKRCLRKERKRRCHDFVDVRIEIEDTLAGSGPSTNDVQPGMRPRIPAGWWLGAVVGVLLLSGVVRLIVARFRPVAIEGGVLRLQINPPEGGRFIFGQIDTGGFAISPDGRTAAFETSLNGQTGLWVQALDGTSAKLLPGTEDSMYPFWSPDNHSIAFFTTSKLQRVDLAGSTPQLICDVGSGRGGTWTEDGRILFGTISAGISQVSAGGGTPTSLTTLDLSRGENNHRWPQMLPNGRFLYWAQSAKPENTGVYATSLANPTERVQLVRTDTNGLYAVGSDGRSYVLWMQGGVLMAQEIEAGGLKLVGDTHPVADPVGFNGLDGHMNVTASANGLLLYSTSNTLVEFNWVDRTGKTKVVSETGTYSAFRLSPDGRRAAFARDATGGLDLWLLDLERGVPDRFTLDSGVNSHPVWSPDASMLLWSFGSPRNLFLKPIRNSGTPQRVTQSTNNQFATDWSRDGRFVLYHEIAPGTQRDLWVVSPTGGNSTSRPYLRTAFNESWGRFSPEPTPRWVAYQSDETRRLEVYVDTFPEPTDKKRISTNGGTYPQWSADGRELFYVSADFKLMAVSINYGGESVNPSASRELFALSPLNTGLSPYDTAPDGQHFLVRAAPDRATSQPLTMIVNWSKLPAVQSRR
jgi:Tol biopolymer transport system component